MLWIFVSVILWGLFHSLLASDRAKELARRLFGAGNRSYRLLYNLFAILSFFPVLVLAYFTPDRTIYLVPWPWMALMLVGQLFAVVMLAVGFRQTDAREFLGWRKLAGEVDPQPHLVKGGLYRYVRHPLYSAGLLFIWLMPLMTANLLVINCALTAYLLVGTLIEERKLKRTFGQAYAEYSANTPMLIPFLRRNKTHAKSSL